MDEIATKAFGGTFEFKDPDAGTVEAVFSTFNVVDADGDVVVPGAIPNAEVFLVNAHRWGDGAIGKGEIKSGRKEARFAGEFWLDTPDGQVTFTKVKRAGDLQQWSWGFRVLEHRYGQFEGREVRFIEKTIPHEVSPVLVGAGVGTHTTSIKAFFKGDPTDSVEGEPTDAKPFPNEHACRLRQPGDFQADSFRRVTRVSDGKKYSVIMGRLKGETTMTAQAYRYLKDTWDAAEARKHCTAHDGILFEPASEGRAAEQECLVCGHVTKQEPESWPEDGELAAAAVGYGLK